MREGTWYKMNNDTVNVCIKIKMISQSADTKFIIQQGFMQSEMCCH